MSMPLHEFDFIRTVFQNNTVRNVYGKAEFRFSIYGKRYNATLVSPNQYGNPAKHLARIDGRGNNSCRIVLFRSCTAMVTWLYLVIRRQRRLASTKNPTALFVYGEF